jgi:hypothetical protein
MTTPVTSVEDQSLFDAIAGLLPAELREHFYRRMAHLRNLTPNDELLQIAEAMGFLAIVTRQAPAEIATERAKLETLFQEAGSALKLAHASTIAYQHELDQRLEELPVGIAVALNPQNVAALLSETLRQQFHEIGIPAVSETLSTQSQILRKTTTEFSNLLETFSDPEHGTLSRVNAVLTSMQDDLNNAASHVRALSHALAKDLHRALAVVSAGALIVGFFLGVFYFQWIRQP